MNIGQISITCFAASYAVALALEATRVLFRARARTVFALLMVAAGLVAHTLFLWHRISTDLSQRVTSPLSSSQDFFVLAAWVLAAAYLGLAIRRPENAVGLFLLPLVLALIGIAVAFRQAAPLPPATALSVWGLVHGIALLVGTVAVTLGFATGLMYLLQSYRLKHKVVPARGPRLPSLEWLENFNRESLLISTLLLAVGLISGVALNLVGSTRRTVDWLDPVVVSSGVLFAWLIAVAVFEACYRPARQGSKVAYLTLASFVFLGLALWFVLFGSHGSA